jgi:metal-responsive CopG/Arc/MetJ family transcriptional regulator
MVDQDRRADNENGGRVVSFYLPHGLAHAVAEVARREERSCSSLVRLALRQYLSVKETTR